MNIRQQGFWELLEFLSRGKRIYGESVLEIKKFEEENWTVLSNRYRPQISVCDTFIDFYYNTLKKLRAFQKTKPLKKREKEFVLTNLQLTNFRRLRGAYLLFTYGYFEESLTLCRTLGENILNLAAIYKLGKKISKKKLLEELIYHNAGLTEPDKKLLEVNLGMQLRAVPDSKFFAILGIKRIKPAESVSVLPSIEGDRKKQLIEVNLNQFLWFMYLTHKTIPYLESTATGDFEEWREFYKKLDELFKLELEEHPSTVSKAVVSLGESIAV